MEISALVKEDMMDIGIIILMYCLWSHRCPATDADSVAKSDNEAYDSLFELSGYPKTGDIPTLNRKIFKGIRVAIREHPYVVSIRRQFSHFLTGALIARNLVLTVAHPLYLVPIQELGVVMGENYADRGTQLQTVILVVIHEDFNQYTLQNDIALLKAYEAPCTKSTVKIIGLIPASRPLVNNNAFVTGWGRCDTMGTELCLPRGSIYYPGEKLDPMLRTIMFQITIPNYYCEGYKRHGVSLYPGMLCVGVAREDDPVASCLAVPGAPLVVRGLLAGVQSWGFGCAYVHDLPLIYTSVQYYEKWITHNVDILSQSTNINYTQLFEATKAYISCEWLKETRLQAPDMRPDILKMLQPTELDMQLTELWGNYYDIRDFMDEGRLHDRKTKMVSYIKRKDNETEKLRNAITKTIENIPFIRKDLLVGDDGDYVNYDGDANKGSDESNEESGEDKTSG